MYPNLKHELYKKGISAVDVEKMTNIQRRRLDSWLNKDVCAPLKEAILVKKLIFPELSVDYLFDFQPKKEVKARESEFKKRIQKEIKENPEFEPLTVERPKRNS